MAEKRRDSKGRILQSGESQRKNGQYEYKYVDVKGERHSVYSWKLVETDKVPAGKRCDQSLREAEKRIRRDVEDDVNSYTSNRMTLNELFADYIGSKFELKQSTRTNYKYMYNKYVRNEIGVRKIANIRYSDIKKFYIHLIRDLEFKPNSIEIIHTVLHPVFTTAVRDGYLRLNPTDGVLAEIKKSHDWEKPKRHALTEAQQSAFIGYVVDSKTYRH